MRNSESAIFISGPGTGLAEDEVPFKYASGMNVLKNSGFEDSAIIQTSEKNIAALVERGVTMPTGTSILCQKSGD